MLRTMSVIAMLAGTTVFTIPKGTDIPVTLDEDVPIEEDRIGETFDATVTRDVEVDGEVVIVAGSPAQVKLVRRDDKGDAATLRLTKVHVDGDMRSVTTADAKADTERNGLSTAEKTAAGAAAGVVVGAVTGASVLEGAIVGAGGGLAWGLLDKSGRQIDDDTPLRFSLEKELEL